MLAGVCSLQFGAALAATLFPLLGALGVVTVRLAGAAIALWVVARPRISGRSRVQWARITAFGAVTACMNVCLYAGIERLALGTAITLEFMGPLVLSLVLSRRPRDAGWALCAGAGVVLLGGGLASSDVAGVAFALGAAGCWAVYIVLNQRMGAGGGMDELALAALVSVVLVAPWGVAHAGSALVDPRVLLWGGLVGVLSSAVPYTADMLALRRLPPRVFSVLVSAAPAVAAAAGWVVLGQDLGVWELVAIGLIVLAGAGITISGSARDTRSSSTVDSAVVETQECVPTKEGDACSVRSGW